MVLSTISYITTQLLFTINKKAEFII